MIAAIYFIVAMAVFSLCWDLSSGQQSIVRRGVSAIALAAFWPALLAFVLVMGLVDLAIWIRSAIGRGAA